MRKDFKDVSIVDKEGKTEYLVVNSPDFFDWKPEEILGKKFTQIYTNIDGESSTFMRAMHKNERFINYEQILKVRSGRTIKLIEDIYLLKNGREVVGAIEFSDYDEEKDLVSEVENEYTENFVEQLSLDDIVGNSDEIQEVKRKLQKIVDSYSPVLIMGETGTGKELLAHVIHNLGKRNKKDFVYLNCSALPESLLEGILFGVKKGSFTDAEERDGLFKQADGGTLFLDEVDSMPLGIQAKILRAIEEKAIRPIGATDEIYIDVRIIASCNLNVNELIKSTRLRNDLLFRFSVIQFELPPLRERGDDVLAITHHYIKYYNKKFNKTICGISPAVEKFFLEYTWPGNVREIKNMLEGIFPFVKNNLITEEDIHNRLMSLNKIDHEKNEGKVLLEEFISSRMKLGDYLDEYEKKRIIEALSATNNDYKLTAGKLGISIQLLKYKMKKI